MKMSKKLKNVLTPEPVASKPSVPVSQPAPKPQPAPIKAAQVALEFVKPGARTVQVAGTFNDWKPERTPLVQTTGGRWIGDVRITPGRHEYLFVVDGQWLPDPKAKESVQNPFGGYNSVLSISS